MWLFLPLLSLAVACGGNTKGPHDEVSTQAGADGQGEAGDASNGGAGDEAGASSTGTGGVAARGGAGGKAGLGGATGAPVGGTGSGESGAPGTGGGTPAAGGAPPDTSSFIRVTGSVPTQLDLLFVIDDSISMFDKQQVLAASVPPFLDRLLNPRCVNAAGEPLAASNAGACDEGIPEFTPIRDLHLGVITSSLGDMGSGDACVPGSSPKDDKGQLVGLSRGVASWNDAGFLAWDPDARKGPPGISDSSELVARFADHLEAVGEQGCGYEMPLEAWYRFLIDPEPPEIVTKDEKNQLTAAGATSKELLAQRAAFLRPNSLVAITMLSDENDCSIIDYGQGWIVGLQAQGTFYMPRATSRCSADPNDECCFSCSTPATAVPAPCPAPNTDPECSKGIYTVAEDHPNLRCFEHKRRFGFDLLQPLQRYVTGLTEMRVSGRKLSDSATRSFVNPLYASPTGLPRERSKVFLTGIVGVPWQDVSDEQSWSDESRLVYLSSDELTAQDRWAWMLGRDRGDAPSDPFMLETPHDRTTLLSELSQVHPAGEGVGKLAPSDSDDPNANPINGHESNILDGSDLQAACLMELAEPRDCDLAPGGCDCNHEDAPYHHANCEGTTQVRARAYPGTRQLSVLKDFGEFDGNAVVGSICAKGSTSPDRGGDPSYGYRPAFDALVDRMKDALRAECLAAELPVEGDGRIPFAMIEARAAGGVDCAPCSEFPARIEPSFDTAELEKRLSDSPTGVCLCEIPQYEAAELLACRNELADPTDGFCYITAAPIDADVIPTEAALLANCPADRKRMLRVPAGVPDANASLFLLPRDF